MSNDNFEEKEISSNVIAV